MPRPGPRGAAPSGEKPGVSRPEAEAAPPSGLREPLSRLGSGGSDQVKVTHCPVRPPTWWGRDRSSKFQKEVTGASPGLRPPALHATLSGWSPGLTLCPRGWQDRRGCRPVSLPGTLGGCWQVDGQGRWPGAGAAPRAEGHGCCGSRGLWAAGERLAGGAWPAATWLLRRFMAGHCPAALTARPASGPLRPL